MTFQPNYHSNQLVASPNVMVGLYCHLNDQSTGLSSLSLVLGSMHVVTRNLLQVFFLALTGILKLLNMDNHAIHFSNNNNNNNNGTYIALIHRCSKRFTR